MSMHNINQQVTNTFLSNVTTLDYHLAQWQHNPVSTENQVDPVTNSSISSDTVHKSDRAEVCYKGKANLQLERDVRNTCSSLAS